MAVGGDYYAFECGAVCRFIPSQLQIRFPWVGNAECVAAAILKYLQQICLTCKIAGQVPVRGNAFTTAYQYRNA